MGNHCKAAQALVQTQDPETVIAFAHATRQSKVYLVAAKFLAGHCHYRCHHPLHSTAVAFFSKAKAFDALTSFYEASAQAAIGKLLTMQLYNAHARARAHTQLSAALHHWSCIC